MKIEPYQQPPPAPRVAWLDGDGVVWLEGGHQTTPAGLPDGYRMWTCYDVAVNQLLAHGQGEALCWNNEPIRWRSSPAHSWKTPRAAVSIRLPFPHEQPELCLQALVKWRDWLRSCGATPQGTLGSSAWSLLRASLSRPLWTNVGDLPPITFTLGGRQEIGSHPGRFDGRFVHVDMPAAYASTLGNMRYGGRWRRLHAGFRWDIAAAENHLIFLRARVTIPKGLRGPLPKRPRVRPQAPVIFDTTHYPTATRLQGVWTWEEIESARHAGCKVSVVEGWLHVPEEWRPKPFADWWEKVQQGRMMHGMAGMLAKATGNAMWGQFCISAGEKSVHAYSSSGKLRRAVVPSHGSRPGSPDLAEQVTGRVRAHLYRMMHAAGPRLVSAHTDGGWVRGPFEQDGWREKDAADRIDLLNPQMLSYVRPGGEQVYVAAGVPARFAPSVFSQAWREAFPETVLVELREQAVA